MENLKNMLNIQNALDNYIKNKLIQHSNPGQCVLNIIWLGRNPWYL